ncbi:MAG: flagellar biosynthesis protein FlhF, partial [SAR86 cluster bacterium]
MSIKRIIAADMTTALKDIRTQLGADAVILSSRKIDEGIEVIASDDLSLQEENASSGYDRARKKMNKASADTSQPVN